MTLAGASCGGRRGADVPLTNVLLLEDRNALRACSAISQVPLVPRPERRRHRAPLGGGPPGPGGLRPGAVPSIQMETSPPADFRATITATRIKVERIPDTP